MKRCQQHTPVLEMDTLVAGGRQLPFWREALTRKDDDAYWREKKALELCDHETLPPTHCERTSVCDLHASSGPVADLVCLFWDRSDLRLDGHVSARRAAGL